MSEQRRWLCAHADQNGEGMHWLEPGEVCPLARRCEAAHPDDPSPCEGPGDAVTVTDSARRSVLGCVRHGAVLLATLTGGMVHVGPGGEQGDAITVYRRAKELRPFEFGSGS